MMNLSLSTPSNHLSPSPPFLSFPELFHYPAPTSARNQQFMESVFLQSTCATCLPYRMMTFLIQTREPTHYTNVHKSHGQRVPRTSHASPQQFPGHSLNQTVIRPVGKRTGVPRLVRSMLGAEGLPMAQARRRCKGNPFLMGLTVLLALM